MASVLRDIFAGESKKGKERGLISIMGQEKLTWWRPLIVQFRPLVIIFNMLLKSRGGGRLLPLGGPQGLRPVQTNEQVYEISWDEFDRPTKVIVHRQVNEF